MLCKQAQVLSNAQIKRVINHLESNTRNPRRNLVMFLLSLHGLRAKEIANIQWCMVRDLDGEIGNVIALQDKATKGSSGRIIPMRKSLQEALKTYCKDEFSGKGDFIVETERSESFSANAVAVFFKRLYNSLGMEDASSHSGRRGFVTNCAKKISLAGGSLVDVMKLCGHKNISTTQRYIDYDTDAQRKVVEMAYSESI